MVDRPARQVDCEVTAVSGLVYRQVHRNHVKKSLRPTSSAFNPLVTGGEGGARTRALSAYNGDLVSAEGAYRHFTQELHRPSVSVLALSEEECTELGIVVDYDGIGFPAHVSLRFPMLSRGATRHLANQLAELAMARGWQFGPLVDMAG